MKVGKKWRVRAMVFLVISLTLSSVALTITILQWNVKTAQPTTGSNNRLENDSLSRHPFSFPQELVTARIHENDYAEVDFVVAKVVDQYLLTMRPADSPRYRTDTVLGIEYARRPLTSADREIIQSLKAELNANPSLQRQRAIQEQLDRIHIETTTRAGTDSVTKYR